MTSATVADPQIVPTAPVPMAAAAAIAGRTPSRMPIRVATARASAVHTAENRFARNATSPSGSRSNSQAAIT